MMPASVGDIPVTDKIAVGDVDSEGPTGPIAVFDPEEPLIASPAGAPGCDHASANVRLDPGREGPGLAGGDPVVVSDDDSAVLSIEAEGSSLFDRVRNVRVVVGIAKLSMMAAS